MKQIRSIILMTVILTGLAYGQYFALAAKWENKGLERNDKKTVNIGGECEDKAKVVTIYLIDKITNEQIYSGGAECKDGKFTFKDDLSKWNIPVGSYKLVVGEGQSKHDYDHVEEIEIVHGSPAAVASQSFSEILAANVNSIFLNAVSKFADGLGMLSEALAEVKVSINSTDFPLPLKAAISILVNSLEAMVSGVGNLFAQLEKLILGEEQIAVPVVEPIGSGGSGGSIEPIENSSPASSSLDEILTSSSSEPVENTITPVEATPEPNPEPTPKLEPAPAVESPANEN